MGVYERVGHSAYWWIRLETTGERIRTEFLVGTGRQARKDSRALAEAEYFKRMQGAGAERAGIAERDPIRFADFAPWFDEHILAHRDGVDRDRGILYRHLIPFFGKFWLTDITRDRLNEYHTARKRFPTVVAHFGGPRAKARQLKPPCNSTINREVDVLKQALARAVPRYLDKSPIEGEAKLDTDDRPIQRRECTDAEFERLLTALKPWDQAILLIGRDCLPRQSTILDLKKTDRQKTAEGRDALMIRHHKTGTASEVPITKRIAALLDALPVTASEYLFPQRRGGETAKSRGTALATAIRRAAARVKVPWGRDTGGNTFHWATRSTGSTRMIDHGGEGVIDAVTKIGGWKNPTLLLERYKQTKQRHVDAVIDRLNKADTVAAKKARRTRQDGATAANGARVEGKAGSRRRAATGRKKPLRFAPPVHRKAGTR